MEFKKHLLQVFEKETKLLHFVNEDAILKSIEFEKKNFVYIFSKNILKKQLYSAIVQKLKINDENFKKILTLISKNKIKLNYFEKRDLRKSLDTRNEYKLSSKLKENLSVMSFYKSIKLTDKDILNYLKMEIKAPLNRRTKKRDQSFAPDLITAIFANFVFNSVPIYIAKKYFLGWELKDDDYFEYCSNHISDNFSKSPSLSIITCVNKNEVKLLKTRSDIAIKNLRNHSHIAIIIERDSFENDDEFWKTSENIILYMEKGNYKSLNFKFIRKNEFFSELENNNNPIFVDRENKQMSFCGIYYIDTFFVNNKKTDYNIIIFEKNDFDETLIPCPSCHSKNVEGNSYSKLGVKSWECKNLLCCDRSRSNRGHRFSFYSELRKQSLLYKQDIISEISIKNWNRDVVYNKSFNQILDFLLRFYSTSKDEVLWLSDNKYYLNNVRKKFKFRVNLKNVVVQKKLEIFKDRHKIKKQQFNNAEKFINNKIGNHIFICADSNNYLATLKNSSIDAAVTSPPYYNAKDYSYWKNVHLYYSDIILNAKHLYNALKIGGVYFFNIFNYFDNENDIVLSAMGKKRLILSSVFVEAFINLGFSFITNIVWDKGHIEGKRGFNNGNLGPFNQKPFNCWEHILVFSKGIPKNKYVKDLPSVFKNKPFYKISKGVNTLGHTAPFPIELPRLITKRMSKGEVILDQYGGSGTTALAAETDKINSIIIEKNKDYFNLSIKRTKKFLEQPTLFNI